MAIQSLLIINKSGGLIYHRNFVEEKENENGLNSNDYLILASTLHGTFAIASQLTPKALQLGQPASTNKIDYNIPYIPYVGLPRNGTNQPDKNRNASGTIGNNSSSIKMGSFKGDDFFKDPFQSWNKSGIRQLCTDQFTMFIYQTMTGLKFVTISSQTASTTNSNNNGHIISIQIADNFLRKVYCLYSDYVMKDPFYAIEMPIKSELFDNKVKQMVSNLA